MAVTNSQIMDELNKLDSDLKLVEKMIEEKLAKIADRNTNHTHELGQRIANTQDRVLDRLDGLDIRVQSVERFVFNQPRNKTMQEKLSDFLAKIMGTPAR